VPISLFQNSIETSETTQLLIKKHFYKVDTLSYKTISANKATAQKEWVVVDATDMVLGRMGSKVAKLLRGKYKPSFTPHVDCGDNVILINAEKVKLTGNKWNDRVYLSHTGYPGGQREITPAKLMEKSSEKLIKKVVKVCYLKTVWEINFWAICMYSQVQNTPCKLNNQNKSI